MRLDKYLVEKGLVGTRSKAVHLIKTENVLINGKIIQKQSYRIKSNDNVELKSNFIYVGRGGYKIEELFKSLNLNCDGKKILDLGCSIGGFSDYFLQNNALKVVSVDVAKDIIHKELLKNPRLKFHSGIDVRDKDRLLENLQDEKFDIITIDISNIPLEEILGKISSFLEQDGFIVALFKPPYEGGKGIVSEEKIEELAKNFENYIFELYKIIAKEFSHLRGGVKGKGNKEIFYILKFKSIN